MRTYSLEIHIKEVKNLSVGNEQPESSSCLIFTHGLADTEQSGAFTLLCKCQILPEQLQITLTIRVGWLFFVSGHDITLWCMLKWHRYSKTFSNLTAEIPISAPQPLLHHSVVCSSQHFTLHEKILFIYLVTFLWFIFLIWNIRPKRMMPGTKYVLNNRLLNE